MKTKKKEIQPKKKKKLYFGKLSEIKTKRLLELVSGQIEENKTGPIGPFFLRTGGY